VRLDWILVSDELEFGGYRTLPDQLSDHLGVVAEIRPRSTTLEREPEPEPRVTMRERLRRRTAAAGARRARKPRRAV
jgi:hypothetical protein